MFLHFMAALVMHETFSQTSSYLLLLLLLLLFPQNIIRNQINFGSSSNNKRIPRVMFMMIELNSAAVL